MVHSGVFELADRWDFRVIFRKCKRQVKVVLVQVCLRLVSKCVRSIEVVAITYV